MGYTADTGIGRGDSQGGLDLTVAMPVLAFLAIALYNVIELNFIIFATFKSKAGLYFWSFLTSTNGIALYSVGFMLKGLKLSDNAMLFVTLIVIGWCTMVTGQSVVLYSRLHLVVRNRLYMRLILGMIIANAFVCHTPIVVMVYGANSSNPDPWLVPYSIYEKVQVTIFFIQELIISSMYIYHTISFFKFQEALRADTAKSMRNHLLWVNFLIIILDITILGLEYAGLYELQTAYKALVYSVKLKMEFSILNQLLDLTKAKKNSSGGGGNHYINSDTRTQTHGGVQLDTIDGDKKNRRSMPGGSNTKKSMNGVGNGVGYNAFVKIGDEDDNIVRRDDAIVVTTATKIVHHQKIDGESLQDGDSIDVTVGREPRGNKLKSDSSSSSSEIQFAREGF
ncbi:hypothetical protein MKZ38_005338 [Zalerion maritima]|uniref:DUF7703 domain-containing protein n=1 Tax=Zalerion maritima TaxID=339359 RepID=A0AAD5RXF8_9PEZI|nr:hypothetical protein MKZ38_005338 [Zalerion maritima]